MPAKIAAIAVAVLAPAYYLYEVLTPEPAPVAAATAELVDRQREALEQHWRDLQRVCRIRDVNRGTAGFQFVKVVRLVSGELCVHFSRANAFGAAVGERWLLPHKGEPQRTRSCDGLPGRDRTAHLIRDLANCPG
ncbi:MAG: hypothetical protein KIT25_09885 [Enhydrobacter sp.]|nr:MAG: hypothetical protein KIT25_09885 [Enhydrobacter sp.]